jgi:hypothetical protein
LASTIALESEVLEKIYYEDIIEDFLKNPKRMKLFKNNYATGSLIGMLLNVSNFHVRYSDIYVIIC